MTVSERTRQKATRLIRGDRVLILGADLRAHRDLRYITAAVQGDSGRYLTTVISGQPDPDHGPVQLFTCTCEAAAGRQVCSHAAALTLILDDEVHV